MSTTSPRGLAPGVPQRPPRLLYIAVAVAALVAAWAACAPKLMPAPVVTVPRFPDFVRPAVPAAFANAVPAINEDRGWRFLQAGDLKNAEHEFQPALRTVPEFYPAETGLGYVELARKDGKAALAHFERALERQGNDASALAGKGQALVALDRGSEAIAAFKTALAVDPSLTDLQRRIEVLTFRSLEQGLARARQAMRNGKLDEAISLYTTAIAASPDSAILYRELAAVERQKGDLDRALEHFRKAASLDATDARSLVQIGEILEWRGDFAAAQKSYADALAIEPSDAIEARIDAVRERIELARMPEEYRAIERSSEITRGDLAALIAVRLAPLVQAGRRGDAVLITDVRGHWASSWILAVARSGVMEPFANHAFQPAAIVRRVDLAQAASRLLARIAAAEPARAKTWETARVKFPDLSSGHLAYPAASMAVAAGVMPVEADNSFQPSKPVSGAEAYAAVRRIEMLAGAARKRKAVQ